MNVVFFTGAGISAESGLRTFRDSDGLWEEYRIEDVATPQAFARDPALVLHFYNLRREQVLKAGPNAAHKAIAELEKHFSVQVVTQNIDDLHERAGSIGYRLLPLPFNPSLSPFSFFLFLPLSFCVFVSVSYTVSLSL